MMDYEKYIDFIREGKYQDAVDYKCTKIPTNLFKYISLGEDIQINESKFDYLEQGKIYLSAFGGFNDPFEGKFFKFDKDKLEEKGWSIDGVKEYYATIANNFRYTCLSETGEQNMPMWAYYANNHAGFCVEYQFIDTQKKYIFPVTYEPERMPANSIITNLIHEYLTLKKAGKDYKESSSDASVYNQLLLLSMAAKHKSWEHEHEYRIITPYGDFPAFPSKIFIGMNCKDEYKKRLIQIGKKLCWICEVYQLYFDDNSSIFELKKDRVI